MSKPKIGIVGASIAGSTIAILLERLGYEVSLFEQRRADSIGERAGAGIALPPALIQALQQEDLLDKNFSSLLLQDRLFFTYEQPEAHLLASIPVNGAAVHWGNLYHQLAKRIPSHIVKYEHKIAAIEINNDKAQLITHNNEKYEFDWVFFADGYRSLGRQFLFPNLRLKFANYTCWQGNFVTADPHIKKQFGHNLLYFLFERGILLAYQIPTTHNSPQDITITWFLYECVDNTHPLVRDQKVHVNIYQDEMTNDYRSYLKKLANTYLAPLARTIVLDTTEPFTHAIYDLLVPSYYSKNIALIGDAGILLRPHLGSGATKALEDALSLHQHLTQSKDVSSWAQSRHKAAAQLFNLSAAFGRFLVTQAPNWHTLDSHNFIKTWDNLCAQYNWYQHQK